MPEVTLNIESLFFLFFIITFFITYITIPIIIRVAEYKNYTDDPNGRSSHDKSVPTLGGVAFFITLILAVFFINKWDTVNLTIYIIPGLTILFLTGLKDDILILSPASKLTAQIVAVIFVLSNPIMHIISLNGFLGIHNIPIWIVIPISILIMVTIINAYNLIDGIDGLASIIGSIICISFGFIFYYLQLYYFAFLSIIILAMLIAFLRYNLSYENKIFMGDTGSLIIGFMISIMTIKMLSIDVDTINKLPFKVGNFPIVIIVIIIIPLFDLLRVFILRLLKKKNPFKPDRIHAHHILIDLGLSHPNASIIIGVINILFIVLFSFLATKYNFLLILALFVFVLICLFYALYRLDFSFSNLKNKIKHKNKVTNFKLKIFKKQNSKK